MPDLKLYYRAIVIKTASYWYSDRQVDQWNRIEDREMYPHTHGHLIFDKGAKTIQWKNDSIFNKLERAINRFIWNNKKPRIAKTLLKDKRTSAGITMPDRKLYYRAIVIKTDVFLYAL